MNESDYSILDIMPQGVCMINQNLEVIFWNKTLEEWTDVKLTQIIGKEIGIFFHHLRQPQYESLIRTKVFDDNTPLIFSALLHKYFFYAYKDEKFNRRQHTTITPIPQKDGEGKRAIIFVQDVTELYTKMLEMKTLRDDALREADELKVAKEEIKVLLSEKELVLKEVHHRIKNNMNTIRGLLLLESEMLKDPVAVKALSNASNRIQSMAILYDKLYRSNNIQEFSMKDYFPSLIDEILENLAIGVDVKIEKKIDDFILDSRRLLPFGIIINELLSNAMKYAFLGRKEGSLSVEVKLKASINDGENISLTVQDNGNGLPESIDINNSTGFGLMLVKMLTKQLNGSISVERENGTKFILEFAK